MTKSVNPLTSQCFRQFLHLHWALHQSLSITNKFEEKSEREIQLQSLSLMEQCLTRNDAQYCPSSNLRSIFSSNDKPRAWTAARLETSQVAIHEQENLQLESLSGEIHRQANRSRRKSSFKRGICLYNSSHLICVCSESILELRMQRFRRPNCTYTHTH